MNSPRVKTERKHGPPAPVENARAPSVANETDAPAEKVCFCRGVSAATIRACLNRKNRDFETLLDITGAGSGCGTCLGDVRRIFDSLQSERTARRQGQLLLPFTGAGAENSKD